MEAVVFVLVVIVAIVRSIYLFIRWAIRSVKRLGSSGPTYTPVQPMTPQGPPPIAKSGANPMPPAPMTRPPLQSGFPPPTVTREATTADFRTQEAALIADEDQPRDRKRGSEPVQSPTPPSAVNPAPLFGTTPDLIRGLILQEVLGPPLSRRRRTSDSGETR